MLQLLCIVVAVIMVVLNNNGTIVRSESPPTPSPFCGYSSTTTTTSTCPGDYESIEFRHPFWIGRIGNRTGDCISYYPGFQITCAANGRPVINLSNSLFYVLSTVYYYGGGGRLRVVDVDIGAQGCQNGMQNIPCLDNYYSNSSGGRSFAFLEPEIEISTLDWYQKCEEAVVVPMAIDNYYHGITNYTRALKTGFVLNWVYPVNCGNCELSGGKCWVDDTNHPITPTTPFHCDCTNYASRVNDICPGSYYNSYGGIGTGTGTPPARFTGTPHRGMSMELKIIIGAFVGVGGLLSLLFVFRSGVYFRLAGASVGVKGRLLSLLIIFRGKCYPLCYSIVSRCRRKIKGPTNVELFLENNYGCLSLQNYKYSDTKKMTNSFKDTLGQGGYGSVFKGKLRNGQLVAVKVLNESKGKGEDFINEVATIGRTNHVNVVSLLGFCAEGTKRALVYEFMPNGSLEKFIHNAKDSSTTGSFLGWEKLYQIALGIARGLEYLHRGCNTRILHFDIKPHNILLDKDFCPKIADFGLAKLCPTRESIVSMVGARGTIGYIAPEVCFRNFGGVSHKSDVYSYGMMVLEMIGGRKNIDATVENISEIYFPQWIYRRLRDDIKVEGSEKRKVVVCKVVVCGEVFAEDVTQKMIIVALWCIQAHPGGRPSMTKVVEMLEGNTEDLQLPPNPFPDLSSKPFPSSS